MTPTEIAEAMAEAYRDRYELTGALEDPIEPCLAAALRALPPGCDLAAVADAMEGQT
jgi:hypothetical protein